MCWAGVLCENPVSLSVKWRDTGATTLPFSGVQGVGLPWDEGKAQHPIRRYEKVRPGGYQWQSWRGLLRELQEPPRQCPATHTRTVFHPPTFLRTENPPIVSSTFGPVHLRIRTALGSCLVSWLPWKPLQGSFRLSLPSTQGPYLPLLSDVT